MVVVEFHFLKIFLYFNPLRYPPGTFKIHLRHVIQKEQRESIEVEVLRMSSRFDGSKVNSCSEGAEYTPDFHKNSWRL
jgi:hypothetical protein